MAVTVYKSTDASAPVLTGQVGSLLALLDACLVNGYGAISAAGWTKPFANAANIGCYKMGAGSLLSISINDAALNTTSLAREAQMRGFETLTSVSAGTGPFPTTAQVAASGLVVRKSVTADATARPWIVVADALTFYLFILSGDHTGYCAHMFGEFFSLKSGDGFRAMIVGRTVQGANPALDSSDNLQFLQWAAVPAVTAGHYVPRNFAGDLQLAINVGVHGDVAKGINVEVITPPIGNGIVQYPNSQDGSVLLSNIWIHDVLGLMGVRGRMRGFWQWLHPASSPVNDGDTFTGAGALAGKTFLIIKPVARGDGLYVMETSNTWETSS